MSRCFPDQVRKGNARFNSSKSLPYSEYQRTQSIGHQQHKAPMYNSLQSVNSSHSSSSRPRLRRELAQDMDDSDINPNINIDLADHGGKGSLQGTNRGYFRLGESSRSYSSRSKSGLNQRSAPGTPMTNYAGKYTKSPSRTPSDDSGHLQVPFSRARGSSLPDGMNESIMKNNIYLLRQFNIRGRKVVHLGDFYQHRATSSSSINSNSVYSNLSIG